MNQIYMMNITVIKRTNYTRKIMLIFILSVFISGCAKEEKTKIAADKMQEFVINISNYARGFDNDFIIIPQNGIELAFNNTDPDGGLNSTYIAAIDGLGVEELFYDGVSATDNYRLSMLQQLKTTEKIMVSEYVTDENNVEDAIEKNHNEDFICFTRTSDNYYYSNIPESITNSNTTDITNLYLAENYLYLISTDNYSSKEEMLNSIAETDYDLILIDLFFDNSEFTSAEIEQLKTKANGGQRLVISYISIGSAENYRYYWKSDWKRNNPQWIKKKYDGYEDEFWVEFWNDEWQNIIYGNDSSYIKKIIDVGFDGVYLDNVEAYYFLYHNK